MNATTIPFTEADFTNEIVKQIRAVDTYGEMDKLPAEKIIAPLYRHQGAKRRFRSSAIPTRRSWAG